MLLNKVILKISYDLLYPLLSLNLVRNLNIYIYINNNKILAVLSLNGRYIPIYVLTYMYINFPFLC